MADSEVHSIKEVSLIIDEEQHVLRYWEREFSFLKPQKNEAGNRIYTSKDLAIVKELKRLIRTERKTIQEARKAFLEQFPDGIVQVVSSSEDFDINDAELSILHSELEEIINKLRNKV